MMFVTRFVVVLFGCIFFVEVHVFLRPVIQNMGFAFVGSLD